MGKTLKGKECGKGICQRKDGKYSARFCGKNGVRKEKHFSTLPEARNWLADQQYNDRHDLVVANPNMTVDVWFEFWLNHLICDLAPNTRRNYQERYTHNIQPVLGNMLIADVKPMQGRPQSHGYRICRFNNSANIHHDGYNVSLCDHE